MTLRRANRELQNDFTDAFARDISHVLHSRNAQGASAADAVTTSFPFALVANSHRISRLIDGCNPANRDQRVVEATASQVRRSSGSMFCARK